jgi:hypothetical protein
MQENPNRPDSLSSPGAQLPDRQYRGRLIVLGLVVGTATWLVLVGLAFTRTYDEYHRAQIAPLLALGCFAGLLGFLRPRQWALAAVALSIPTIVGNIWLFSGVEPLEWEYVRDIGLVALCTVLGACVGALINRWRWPNKSLERTREG